MSPAVDTKSADDMPLPPQTEIVHKVSPMLILSPSSLSHRPAVLESIICSLPPSQPHDLHMLDRIALNFAKLPPSYYGQAILALPAAEEKPGEADADYTELKAVFKHILDAMQPGGRVRIGQAAEDVTREAILVGFLIEKESEEVFLVCFSI